MGGTTGLAVGYVGTAMQPDDWSRTCDIFAAAVLREPSTRAAFLDEACGGNAHVRAEVESLLSAHDGAEDLFERPAFEVAAELMLDDGLDGQIRGPYIVRHEIGRGGMGVVYLAEDTRLARRVALKALPPEATHAPQRRERLRQEARAAAALSHPGIATIYAIEEIEGALYLAAEYVAGPTLRALVDAGPVPVSQVVDIGVQVARALEAAHAQGVVHRDLKPENVVRTGAGAVKILDFGIARAEHLSDDRLTVDTETPGTPGYMAPEQIRAHAIDFRADLFAFGVLLYELASGASPFVAETRTATTARVLDFEPPPLSHARPDIPPALEQIVTTCLRKDPSSRYRSTSALVADLEHVQRDMRDPRDILAARVPSGRVANPAADTARRWWEFHQAAVSALDVLMMYPVWLVRAWLPAPWGLLFLLTALASTAAATTLRLHGWFLARHNVTDPVPLATSRGMRAGDLMFSITLVVAALGIGATHASTAMLLLTVGIATGLASWVIEPATARAAFQRSSD